MVDLELRSLLFIILFLFPNVFAPSAAQDMMRYFQWMILSFVYDSSYAERSAEIP